MANNDDMAPVIVETLNTATGQIVTSHGDCIADCGIDEDTNVVDWDSADAVVWIAQLSTDVERWICIDLRGYQSVAFN